ncbi:MULTISPECIES: hypothetical protein [unclassified Methylibium]|uniref:hypothetical protein n=1 Tax=unclassified Methylibium TaxID=2633235 RepID=UPI001F336442|nr:hypothetical protein [Methylibium sp. Root1272]
MDPLFGGWALSHGVPLKGQGAYKWTQRDAASPTPKASPLQKHLKQGNVMFIKPLLAAVVLASALAPSFADQKAQPATAVQPTESEVALSATAPASEPSNLALMLAAVGVLGFVAHRRGRHR